MSEHSEADRALGVDYWIDTWAYWNERAIDLGDSVCAITATADEWKARAVAAEAELASVRSEAETMRAAASGLADETEAAESRVAQLEAALRERDALLAEMTSGDPHFVTPHDQRYISTFGRCFTCGQLWPCAHVRARALLASPQ